MLKGINYDNHAACKQAERLFNLYQVEVIDMTLDDKLIEATLKCYYEVIQELRDNGIGGVLINGTFRNLY